MKNKNPVNAPEPIFNDGGGPRWDVLIMIILIVGVLSYIGYNYWYDCFDVGIFKACGMVKKPF